MSTEGIPEKRRWSRPAREDVLGIAGFASLVAGCALLSVPAALIVAGVLLLAAAYMLGRNG